MKPVLVLTTAARRGGIARTSEAVLRVLNRNGIPHHVAACAEYPGIREKARFLNEVRRLLPHSGKVLSLHLNLVRPGVLFTSVRVTVFLHGIECWRRTQPLPVHYRYLVNSRTNLFYVRGLDTGLMVDQAYYPGLPLEADRQPERRDSMPTGRVLMVSRLERAESYKGISAFLEAARQLHARFPGLRFDLAGSGDAGALKNPGYLPQHVALHESPDDVQLDALYRQADLIVLPSTHEGQGLALFEGAERGAVPVGLRGTVAEEWISHGKNGLLANGPDNLIELLHGVYSGAFDLAAMRSALFDHIKMLDVEARFDRLIQSILHS